MSLLTPSETIQKIKHSINDWLTNATFVAKFLVIISLGGALICLVNFNGIYPQQFFINTPYLTIESFQIYRIFISWIMPTSFFGGIMQAISIFPVAQKIETRKGSIFLLCQLAVLNSITQLLFAVMAAVLGKIFLKGFSFQSSVGLWDAFFNILPIALYDTFEQRRVPFFLLKIPPKIYPFVLCIFFQFFGPSFSLIVATFVGHFSYYETNYLDITKEKLKRIEKLSFVVLIRSYVKNFVVADSSEYNGLPAFIPFSGSANRAAGGESRFMTSFVQSYVSNTRNRIAKNNEFNKKIENSIPNSDSTDLSESEN